MTKNDFLEQAKSAAQSLVKGGYLLEEDTDRVLDRAAQTWDRVNR